MFRLVEAHERSPGLVFAIDNLGNRDIWSIGKLRSRDRTCAQSGDLMKKGDVAWRPLTNGNHRGYRISERAMRQTLAAPKEGGGA